MKSSRLPHLVAIGRNRSPLPIENALLRPRGAEGRWEPATDIHYTGEAFMLRMELAGVKAEHIDLTIEGRFLRIRGERPSPCFGGGCEYRQVEISYGNFERAFEFPFLLSDAKLEATCADGFLTIRVEPAAAGPRRIEIRGAE